MQTTGKNRNQIDKFYTNPNIVKKYIKYFEKYVHDNDLVIEPSAGNGAWSIPLRKYNLIAFDSGYTKSRTAILDANITTLLAAIILFFMGSGPIKGFSLTLGIGIFTTLFSVYFIARLLTVLYVSKNKEKEGLI